MTDPATTAQRQQAQQQGLIAQILTLLFRFLGVLIGSLFLAVLIEWVGMVILWPDQGWHHAQAMLHHETDQLAADFFDSLLVHEPAHTAQVWLDAAYRLVFIKTGLLGWIRDADAQTHANGTRGTDLRHYLGLVAVHLEDYLLAALYTGLTLLVRDAARRRPMGRVSCASDQCESLMDSASLRRLARPVRRRNDGNLQEVSLAMDTVERS